eukprot:gene26621-biopygen17013
MSRVECSRPESSCNRSCLADSRGISSFDFSSLP